MTSNPTPLSPDNDRDFQQLTGALDRPVAPSSAFAERLRQQAISARNEEKEKIMEHVAPASAPISVPRRISPMPKPDQSPGWFLEIAAAAMLVVALLGAGFFANRSGSNPDDGRTRLAAISGTATQKAATPPSAVIDPSPARGGIFGTASDLNPTYPDSALPGGPLAPTWGKVIAAPQWMNPYGDVVAALGTSDLSVFDASTGDVLWSKPVSEALSDRLSDDPGDASLGLAVQGTGTIALPWIDDDTLYVTTATELVGLDLMTGTETFRTPHNSGSTDARRGTEMFPSRLAIDNGVAYLLSSPDESGKTLFTAIDLSSGIVIWQVPKDSSTPYGYLIVSNNRLIYIVDDQDDNQIIALDPADGSLAWETEDVIYDEALRGHDYVSLFVADGVIVETRTTTSPTADAEQPAPEDALRLAAYDLDSGDFLWTSRSDNASWGLDADTINVCGFFPRVSGGSLIVPCGEASSSVMTLVSLSLHGNGQAETVTHLEVTSATPTTSFIAADSAWVYAAGNEIVRLDLSTGAITTLGTMGGEVCDQRSLPTDGGFVCLTTDGIGTYTIQAFGPTANATPVASPEASSRTGQFPAAAGLGR